MGLKGVATGTRACSRAVLRVADRRARVDGARAGARRRRNYTSAR